MSLFQSSTDFQGRRWRTNVHLALRIALLIAFVTGLNILAHREFQRVDLTEQRLFSLGPETVAYLQGLEAPVDVHVTISGNDPNEEIVQMFRDVRGLLREYQYSAPRRDGESLVRVHFHDVFRQRQKAQMLMQEFGESEPNRIIFAGPENYRIINPDDIYRVQEDKRTQFQGERIFTSAILEVSQDRQTTIYFTRGHGEMELDSTDPTRGLSHLGSALQERNFRLRYIDLMKSSRIPDDADLVIIAGPQVPLLRNEENVLQRYLEEQQGRVMLMLEPGQRHGLEETLFDWGILVDDVIVFDDSPGSTLPGGDMIITHYGEHPITEPLYENNLRLLIGLTRSVRQDPISFGDESLQITPLLGTSENAWGERDYRNLRENPTFDPNRDLPGPLSIAAVSERNTPSQLGIDIPGGRLIVFGSSDLASNQRVVFPTNFQLMLNSINWIVDRDTMVNIPPRAIEPIDIVLTQEQSRTFGFILSLIAPGFIALVGLFIYWIRRK